MSKPEARNKVYTSNKMETISEGQETGAIATAPENAIKKNFVCC
jgi:hypothetical protein